MNTRSVYFNGTKFSQDHNIRLQLVGYRPTVVAVQGFLTAQTVDYETRNWVIVSNLHHSKF